MSDVESDPPTPSSEVRRAGQAQEHSVAVVHSGVPTNSRIAELPAILLDGAREAAHSELTWKLISKIASQGEDDRASLRDERDRARDDTERWRKSTEDASNELIGLKARWESVNTLTNAQALLYVVGGVLMGPAAQDVLSGRWVAQTILVAILGIGAVGAGFMLGKLGPTRKI